MSDSSAPLALSMHQPWASLVVYGLKRIEGRSWPTKHRGRLWIHATAQAPSQAVIQETEAQFRGIWELEGCEPSFPKFYPTSALLGCVDIVDCLRAECIEAWPDIPESVRAEVGSPYGFLCQHPKRLVVPQKISGSQKLWSLPARVARDMEPALRSPPQIGREPWTWPQLPESLRTADLPGSANGDSWAERYFSPRGHRGKTDSPHLSSNMVSPKQSKHGSTAPARR